MGARCWVLVVFASCAAIACGPEDTSSREDSFCTRGGLCPQAGNAAPMCLPHEQLCADRCVDVRTSALDCGGCGLACAPGLVCEAGACRDVCGAGMGFCAGACVTLASHPAHCGGCDRACLGGEVCVAGACSATCNGTVCATAVGNQCIDTLSDRAHCGGCNLACAAADKCEGGQCVLDCGALSECSGVCVDLLASDMHCGQCGVACAAGKRCDAGSCACAEGLTACGEACVDTTQDPEHCGACDQACGGGGGCEAGKCVGPDGCSDVLVRDLTLGEVAVYQSVKVAIMQGGTAVPETARNADLVQGRPAVFRVHVTPSAGFAPREVSARIEITSGDAAGEPQLYFARGMLSGASSDEDPASTLNVEVPAEALTAGARYAVSLVECGASAAAGAAMANPASTFARFPSDGYEELHARATGPLRVHLIPLDQGGGAPELTEEAVELYRARLFAVYPVTAVEITVGETLVNGASSMCNHLAAISAQRSADDPPIDLYYYGMTLGTSGGQSGCSSAIQSASSTGKTSAGWHTLSMRDDGSTGASTMCHELGHAHGRLHAPCGVQDPDRSYPYPNADIGVWAHDLRTGEFLPPMRKDMMSYCPNPDRSLAWLSDYTYQAILERVADVNELVAGGGGIQFLSTAPKLPWRMLIVDASGVHWGTLPLYVRGTPEGTPLTAIAHDDSGPTESLEVYRQDLEAGATESYFLIVPEGDPRWVAIEVPGLLAKTAL